MRTAAFGFLGVLFVKLEFEPAPLLLGFVLGPMMEENLRRAMLLSRGDPMVFLTPPDLSHHAAHGCCLAAPRRGSKLPQDARSRVPGRVVGRLTRRWHSFERSPR